MNEKLLKYLVEHRVLTQEQADELLKAHMEEGRSVRELLAEGGLASEEQLIEAQAAVTHLPVIRLYEQQIPLEVRQLVRADLLRTHVVLPFAFGLAPNG